MTHPFQSDQPPMPPPPPPDQGDVTGGLIPYKNPQALTAYYMGIFGLFPAIGFVLAVPAVILGIVGLRKYGQNPAIKGIVHAWVGIALGGLSMLYNGVFIVIIVVAWIGSP